MSKRRSGNFRNTKKVLSADRNDRSQTGKWSRARKNEARNSFKDTRKFYLDDHDIGIIKGMWNPLDGHRRYTIGQIATWMNTSKEMVERSIENESVQPIYGPC